MLKLIEDDLQREIIAHSVEEMSAAAEIFIAETYARLYYNQILDSESFPGLMGSQQFLAWVNDHTNTKTGRVRPGLLRLYIADNPSHFEGGRWLAVYIPVAMAYVRDRMQDRDYVRRAEIRALAARSFADPGWLRCATGLFGVKMLELLASRRALRTQAARAIVEANLRQRALVKQYAMVLGRAKKDGFPDEALARLEQIVNKTAPLVVFRDVLRVIDAGAGSEYRNYRKVKPRLEKLLQEVARQAELSLSYAAPALPGQVELFP